MSATEAQAGLGLERDFDSDFALRVGFIRPLSFEFTSRIELEVELKAGVRDARISFRSNAPKSLRQLLSGFKSGPKSDLQSEKMTSKVASKVVQK